MKDLSQIRTLLLLRQLGSMAAVSKKLNISSAAVSKQLSKLEEELGIQLIIRSTRHLEFTDIGESYCLQCERILEEVESASYLISQQKKIPTGRLKVISGRHFARVYIIPFMKEFLAKYPKIEINLELAERIVDIDKESVDVLIGMSVSAVGNAIQKRIATTSYVFCASPDYFDRYGFPKKPQDLKKHQYITHSMRQPDNELTWDYIKKTKIEPFLRVNDTETMLDFALQGLGIVKLHRYEVEESLKTGALIETLTNYTKQEIPLYVAYPERRYVSSKVRQFIDFIVNKIPKN